MHKKLKTSFWENVFNILDFYHQNRIVNFLRPLHIYKVIDVGSHKGEFLSYILKLKNVKKIFAFEPQIAIYKILSKNFSHKKIKITNIAIDKEVSKKYIYINKFTNTSTLSILDKKSFYLKFKNLLTGSKKNFVQKYIVKTNTIDNLFCNIKLKNSLLKIDVEGFELNVLKGMKEFLLNTTAAIELELNSRALNLSNTKFNELLSILKEFNYVPLRNADIEIESDISKLKVFDLVFVKKDFINIAKKSLSLTEFSENEINSWNEVYEKKFG